MCTLQDANFPGYDCLLVTDCTATTSPDCCWQATLYNLEQCLGFVVESHALFDRSRRRSGGRDGAPGEAGGPLAVGIVYSRIFEKVAYTFIVPLQTVPKVALAPLVVHWFGYGLLPRCWWRG